MSAPPPDHDWRPALPIDSLSPASATAARSAVRELQGQLIEWRLLADRTANATLRGVLYRNLRAWHALLDVHQPDPTGRCRRCRGRWGRWGDPRPGRAPSSLTSSPHSNVQSRPPGRRTDE